MLVATVGVSWAVVANLVAKHMDWRVAYWVGGGLGLVLLVLRIRVRESAMFARTARSDVRWGDFLALFRRGRLGRYLATILIGVPTWFSNAILVALSPEFARLLGVQGRISAGDAVMMFYGGLVFGDVHERHHDRRRAVRHEPPRDGRDHRAELRPRPRRGGDDLVRGAPRPGRDGGRGGRRRAFWFALVFVSAWRLRETFGIDLDYVEKG